MKAQTAAFPPPCLAGALAHPVRSWKQRLEQRVASVQSRALEHEQRLPELPLGALRSGSVYRADAEAALRASPSSTAVSSDVARSTQGPHSPQTFPGQDSPFPIVIILPRINFLQFLSGLENKN